MTNSQRPKGRKSFFWMLTFGSTSFIYNVDACVKNPCPRSGLGHVAQGFTPGGIVNIGDCAIHGAGDSAITNSQRPEGRKSFCYLIPGDKSPGYVPAPLRGWKGFYTCIDACLDNIPKSVEIPGIFRAYPKNILAANSDASRLAVSENLKSSST